mmetsp:Transcript_119498/g.372311  ORF Transcript_119498/g.372311 Transcript_119498/m.372311 type:complete len:273 (+) Transcript_119498:91-909(+)
MGFLEESLAASWLFGQFGQPAKSEKRSGFGDDAGSPERGFDLVDCMEKGMARELVSDFVQPLREVDGLWKFNIERSADRREYRLYCARGEFLMLAKVSKDGRSVAFFLYDSGERSGLHDPEAPAFTMTCNASRTEWRLAQERSDADLSPRQLGGRRRERREVMDIAHTRQCVGSGLSYCLDVRLLPTDRFDETRLVSKLPVWNEEVQSMVLDFRGRQAVASAKNFQLAPDGDPEHVVCQHAKTGPNSFGLDFKCPLTVIEAFGVALTSIAWV